MKRRKERGVGGRVKKEVKPVVSRSSSMGKSSKTHGLMGFVDVLGVSTGVCLGDDTISSSIAVYNHHHERRTSPRPVCLAMALFS